MQSLIKVEKYSKKLPNNFRAFYCVLGIDLFCCLAGVSELNRIPFQLRQIRLDKQKVFISIKTIYD